MAETNDASARWATSIIASLFLHAGVVALFAAPGCEGPSPFEGDELEPSAVAKAEPSPAEGASGAEAPAPSATAADPVRPVQPAATAASPSEPAPARPASPRPAIARVPPTSPDDAARELPELHVVRQGDTLTKIAREYGTTPEELAKANGKALRKMNLLWVGQKIKLRK